MKEREHYYYVFDSDIVKAFNQKDLKKAGYDLTQLKMRTRHYYEASRFLHTIGQRPRYVSLTGNDFID